MDQPLLAPALPGSRFQTTIRDRGIAAVKLALPIWENRISPVFDVARQLVVVELEAGSEITRTCVPMEPTAPQRRVQMLVEQGIDTLVCGGISQVLEELLAFHRIVVIAWMTGEVDQVVAAYLSGALRQSQFAMPGCSGRGRGRRGRGGRGGRGVRHGGLGVIREDDPGSHQVRRETDVG